MRGEGRSPEVHIKNLSFNGRDNTYYIYAPLQSNLGRIKDGGPYASEPESIPVVPLLKNELGQYYQAISLDRVFEGKLGKINAITNQVKIEAPIDVINMRACYKHDLLLMKNAGESKATTLEQNMRLSEEATKELLDQGVDPRYLRIIKIRSKSAKK